MKDDVPRVLIGIFSFNESERLKRSANQLFIQASGLNSTFVLLDESTEAHSRAIAENVAETIGGELLPLSEVRRGKTACLNLLAERFRDGTFDMLIHIDADLMIDPGCVTELVKAIESGVDIASVLSLCSANRSLFGRAVRLTLRPMELLAETGGWEYPLVAHGGAYSPRAVEKIFPIPQARTHEDLLILAKAMQAHLRSLVIPTARVHHRAVDNASDYLLIMRRHFGRSTNFDRLKLPGGLSVRSKVSSVRSPRLLVRAVREDVSASFLLPYILLLRNAAEHSAEPYPTETWDVVSSTKD